MYSLDNAVYIELGRQWMLENMDNSVSYKYECRNNGKGEMVPVTNTTITKLIINKLLLLFITIITNKSPTTSP